MQQVSVVFGRLLYWDTNPPALLPGQTLHELAPTGHYIDCKTGFFCFLSNFSSSAPTAHTRRCKSCQLCTRISPSKLSNFTKHTNMLAGENVEMNR